MATPPKLKKLDAARFSVPQEQRPLVNTLLSALNPFLTDTSSALNKALTLTDNLTNEVKDVEVVVPAPTWTTLSLSNNWVSFSSSDPGNTPAYTLLPNGVVMLRGLIKDGTTSFGTVITTLPVECAPEYNMMFSVAAPAIVNLEVRAGTGQLIVVDGGSSARVSLAGITFPSVGGPAMPAFSGNGWPIRLTPTRVKTVTRVTPLKYTDLSSLESSVPAGVPDWTLDANGNVIIKSVWGLNPGRRYKLSFLLES